jgi:SAM-dependent methyltransferase
MNLSNKPGEEHLWALRLWELKRARRLLPDTGTVLEIGAGPGWQARALAAEGLQVVAVDIAASRYAPVWPVLRYDGRRLPFRDGCFDAVFSSNVLEHVVDLSALLAEMARVLKPGGCCVHVLPTPAWRLWTTATHYPHMARLLFRALFARSFAEQTALPWGTSPSARLDLIRCALWPQRHGEQGSALSEVALFRRGRWQALFERAGFRMDAWEPGGLAYTGNALLGPHLTLKSRARLSPWLGSATAIFLLRRQDP